jgi:hypothetical protein
MSDAVPETQEEVKTITTEPKEEQAEESKKEPTVERKQ